MISLFEGGVLVSKDMCSQLRFLDEIKFKDVEAPQK